MTALLSLRAAADDAELDRLAAELTRRCPDLPRPIRVEWSESSLVVVSDQGVPWWVGPAELDPLRDHRGRLPMPRAQRARLRKLAELDLPFRRVAIAHELDAEGPVRDLLPTLRGPYDCTEATARTLVGPPPAHPGVRRAARALERLVGGAAGRLADTGLDPVVIGVVAPRAPRPGDPTLWVPLAVWRW